MNKFWMIVFSAMFYASMLAAFIVPDSMVLGCGVFAALAWTGITWTRCQILEERITQMEGRK